jgi:hypothetical protein
MILQDFRTKENRYRHYKGGIYYKLGEGHINNKLNKSYEFMGVGFYEKTRWGVEIWYNSKSEHFMVVVDNKIPKEISLENVIIYQSEETGTIWVREKNEWEGFTDLIDAGRVKRFTLANA